MYRRRCEPDERVLLVRGGRFVKHMVRYIPLSLKSGENVSEAMRSRRTRTFSTWRRVCDAYDALYTLFLLYGNALSQIPRLIYV